MPSSTNHARGHDEIKALRRVICEKSASLRGEISEKITLRRPELLACRNAAAGITLPRPVAKLLVNVTIRGSVGPMQVLMSPEATVADLVTAFVQQYSKERRRPVLPSADPADFNLHESQFSLESLNRGVKLGALGRRNFFLCPRKPATEYETTSFSSSCKEAEGTARSHSFGCLIMLADFLFKSDGIVWGFF